ncbi:hypothetical protein [Paracoccus litorisediminis]|uniref:Uncharacterized protein n=1 Tax=Paracoccus litorisediminis TaxID=2006130 RepID=A0A844HSM4_9RHOB|nr:hypothetical protein [Paracoccus litorisediminis]MTH62159.1 hypothetical protein [Paracoccus litorisediminis]
MNLTGTTIQDPTNMMDKGEFLHFHTWRDHTGAAIEYWRGTQRNGACVRTLNAAGEMTTITHYADPGAALQAIRPKVDKIPGIPH